MSQQASASPSLEIESSQLVKVIVGPTAHCQPFILSRRALEFYSPYLRTLTEKAGASSTISLHGDTPAPFEVLVAWMNLDAAPSPCHQRGVALDKLIEVEDDEGVRLAYRVWVLAHRLGGPCLVLGDQCMRYLYKEYVMPIPGSSGLVVNPATAFLVAKHARDSRKLERFVLACLTLDGLRSTAAQTAADTWDSVLEQVPEFRVRLEELLSKSREQRLKELLALEEYMSVLGDVTPGWYQEQAAGEGSG